MISRSSSFMSSANVERGALSLNTNVVMSQGSQVPPVSAAPDGCSAAVAGVLMLTGEAGPVVGCRSHWSHDWVPRGEHAAAHAGVAGITRRPARPDALPPGRRRLDDRR